MLENRKPKIYGGLLKSKDGHTSLGNETTGQTRIFEVNKYLETKPVEHDILPKLNASIDLMKYRVS